MKGGTGRWRRWAAAAAVVGVAGYFLLGAAMTSAIDDDLSAVAAPPDARPIHIARTLENILTREIEHKVWRPSAPWFYPTALTDDGKNFQLGVLHGLRRSLQEYATRTIRLRRDASIDGNLQQALNQIQYPPGVWMLDLSQGFGASSQSQYVGALEALRAFETEAASGVEVAELRADQLLRFVDAINVDLNAHVLALQDYALNKAGLIDTKGDDLFYQTKGAGFVYAALAPAIRRDFAPVFEHKRLDDLWRQFETNLDHLARLAPLAVVTARDDSLLFPNHLLVQGFYASRCAEILTRIEDILKT
jgi:hypothetical protein